MRRSRTALERAIGEALTKEERALAHYNLALFHDNNGRERRRSLIIRKL
jgi:hypothetical protein